MMIVVCASLIALSAIQQVSGLSSGPPLETCDNLVPGHPRAARDGFPGGFYITSDLVDNGGNYTAGQIYNVQLQGVGRVFRGFMIQVRDTASGMLIGTFTLDAGRSQFLNCFSNDMGTVAHNNNNDKSMVQFTWMAPDDMNGTASILYTVVTTMSAPYYAAMNAADFRPPPPGCPAQRHALSDFSFTTGLPANCMREDCDFFIALGPNLLDPNSLEIYLEGEARGWVAVGFSDDAMMGETDVLGCNVDASSIVNVVDTWNPLPNQVANEPDVTNSSLCVYETMFTGDRISCQFSRTVMAQDLSEDFNLNEPYLLFYGRRLVEQTMSDFFAYHMSNSVPTRSAARVNPVQPVVPQPSQFVCPSAPPADAEYTFTEGVPGDPYYFGARLNDDNPDYVDMILEANTEGWVAVGFSATQDMDAADVVGCIRTGNGDEVLAADSWNLDVTTGAPRSNVFDSLQEDICQHNASFSDGRISCTFSRFILPTPEEDPAQVDVNLNGSWFQMYGTGNSMGSGSFPQHENTPSITASQVNLITDTGSTIFPECELTQVHGIFMIVAWPLLVTFAIFLAAWMKPALPNGEWFQVHRVFMVISLFVTAIGFIFIFVANLGAIVFSGNPTGTAHFVIGIIVFALQIANPIIAIFRCAPSGSNRWIFNLSHGTVIGLMAELLALANVGIGIYLFESGSGCSQMGESRLTAFWVYIAYIIFTLLLQFIMFIVFAIVAANAELADRRKLAPSFIKYFFPGPPPKKANDMEMTSPDKEKSKEPAPPARKPPSDDAYLRWVGFGVYFTVTFILMLVIIIMVAVLPWN